MATWCVCVLNFFFFFYQCISIFYSLYTHRLILEHYISIEIGKYNGAKLTLTVFIRCCHLIRCAFHIAYQFMKQSNCTEYERAHEKKNGVRRLCVFIFYFISIKHYFRHNFNASRSCHIQARAVEAFNWSLEGIKPSAINLQYEIFSCWTSNLASDAIYRYRERKSIEEVAFFIGLVLIEAWKR